MWSILGMQTGICEWEQRQKATMLLRLSWASAHIQRICGLMNQNRCSNSSILNFDGLLALFYVCRRFFLRLSFAFTVARDRNVTFAHLGAHLLCASIVNPSTTLTQTEWHWPNVPSNTDWMACATMKYKSVWGGSHTLSEKTPVWGKYAVANKKLRF